MRFRAALLFAFLASATSAPGDVLEMKNGNVMNGKDAGGTATTVRFETGDGPQVVETAQIIALTFTAAPSAAAPAAAAAPAPPAAPAAQPVTVPPGTSLLVRMMDGIS